MRMLVLTGLVLVSYMGALNRGQPILWGISAILLAGLVIGYVMPWWLVKRVTVSRFGPHRADEDSKIELGVSLTNFSWVPRYMLEVTDHLPFLVNSSTRQAVVLGQVAFLPGHGQRHLQMQVTCEKRGLYQLGPVGLASRFPLGLIERKREMQEQAHHLTIYPKLFTIVSMPLLGTPQFIDRGLMRLPENKGSAEFRGLREYQLGDHPKYIHWLSTARNRKLMVREFEANASANLVIVLDLHRLSEVGEGKNTTLEYAIKIAGSIAQYACQNNISFGLHAAGQIPLPAGFGEVHYQAMLYQLAILQANGDMPYAQFIESLATQVRAGDTLVVFIATASQHMQALINALALMAGRGVRLYAVAFDRKSFDEKNDTNEHWIGELHAMGAYVISVANGDDLMMVFNQ